MWFMRNFKYVCPCVPIFPKQRNNDWHGQGDCLTTPSHQTHTIVRDNYRKCMDLMKSEVVITITRIVSCTRLSRVAIQVILPNDLKFCFRLLLVREQIFMSFANLAWSVSTLILWWSTMFSGERQSSFGQPRTRLSEGQTCTTTWFKTWVHTGKLLGFRWHWLPGLDFWALETPTAPYSPLAFSLVP